jgi:hypothetical protein
MRLAVLTAANPPTTLFGPLLATEPLAVEPLIEPSRFPAAKPPRAEFEPPLTLPYACEFVMVPWFPPTKPPAVALLPTVTVVGLGKPGNPGTPAKLESIVPLLLPANPPALLFAGDVANGEAAGDRAAVVSGEAARVAAVVVIVSVRRGRGTLPHATNR